MASIAQELKKLFAKITNVNEPQAIPGNSISEIIAFASKNLNVDANGNLEVYVPVVPIAVIDGSCAQYNDAYIDYDDVIKYLSPNAHGVEVPGMLEGFAGGDIVNITFKIGDSPEQTVEARISKRGDASYRAGFDMFGILGMYSIPLTLVDDGAGNKIEYIGNIGIPATNAKNTIHIVDYEGSYATELPTVQILKLEKVQ